MSDGSQPRAGDTDQRGDDESVLFAKDFFEFLTRLRHAGDIILSRGFSQMNADRSAFIREDPRLGLTPMRGSRFR